MNMNTAIINRIKSLLTDERWYIRIVGFDMLKDVPEADFSLVELGLGDSHPTVRVAAAEVMRYREDAPIDLLEAIIFDSNKDPEVVRNAAICLVKKYRKDISKHTYVCDSTWVKNDE